MKELFYLSLTIFFSFATICLWQVSQALVRLPGLVDQAVQREAVRLDNRVVAVTQTLDWRVLSMERRAASIESRADRQLTALRTETMALVDRHADRVTGIVDAHLTEANNRIAELAEPWERVPADAKWATRQIWDCEANPDCLENRYVSVSRAIERSSREVERAAPAIGSAVERSAVAAELTARNSAYTADRAGALLYNLERQTRPLPHGLAIFLRLLGPAAQIATLIMFGSR